MDTLVQADIFFFITSIAVIAISALSIVFLSYAIGIARDVRKVMKIVKTGSSLLMSDVEAAREFLRKEGAKAAGIAAFFGRFAKSSRAKAKRRTKRAASEEASDE